MLVGAHGEDYEVDVPWQTMRQGWKDRHYPKRIESLTGKGHICIVRKPSKTRRQCRRVRLLTVPG